MSMRMPLRLALILALSLACPCLGLFAVEPPASAWGTPDLGFRATNITATGGTFWVSGTDETIASSADGGATWQIAHSNANGDTLLNLAFANDRVGHALGANGLLLATADSGKTWRAVHVEGAVRGFAFFDAQHGLVIVGGRPRKAMNGMLDEVNGLAVPNGMVEFTHDGGQHWDDVSALQADAQLKPFSEVRSVATLNEQHFLIGLHRPEGENMYAVSVDGGKTWKAVQVKDTFADAVFVHAGEYWAFGEEYLDRKNHGGYSAPVSLHSSDGVTWKHGPRGPKEFSSCNVQGCYLADGVVESLYGEHESFWALPQDGSLTSKWAIAGDRLCSIGSGVKCTTAIPGKTPQPPRQEAGVIHVGLSRDFAQECIDCPFTPIPAPDGPRIGVQLTAAFTLRRNGTVSRVSIAGSPTKPIGEAVGKQLALWLFEPGQSETGKERNLSLELALYCSGFPGRPETGACVLSKLPPGR